jgi:uncharacterized protein (DUF1015 family)
MYLDRAWHRLRPRVRTGRSDPIRSLDVSILQEQLLEPILGIGDIRTDPRIAFVGGARGRASSNARSTPVRRRSRSRSFQSTSPI